MFENVPVIRSVVVMQLKAQNYSRAPGQDVVNYDCKKLAILNKANLIDLNLI